MVHRDPEQGLQIKGIQFTLEGQVEHENNGNKSLEIFSRCPIERGPAVGRELLDGSFEFSCGGGDIPDTAPRVCFHGKVFTSFHA
jgi:hypothetical protein